MPATRELPALNTFEVYVPDFSARSSIESTTSGTSAAGGAGGAGWTVLMQSLTCAVIGSAIATGSECLRTLPT